MAGQPSSSSRPKLLVLADPAGQAAACAGALASVADVRVVHSAEDALRAMESGDFALIVSPRPELHRIAQVLLRDQRQALLDTIGQGFCVVAPSGELLWANEPLRAYPDEVLEQVRRTCAELIPELEADRQRPARRRALRVGELDFDVHVSALRGADGTIERIAGLVSDATAISRMRERLDAIDSAGRELVALDADAGSRLEVDERLAVLEEKLIHYCRDLLHFSHFAVLILDPHTKRLETVLMGGFPEQARALNLYAREEGNGISGYVAATGRSYICPDVSQDPLYLTGLESARSSLTVPLRLIDHVVGVLNVEADRPNAFTDEDRQVAEIFARYIAVALHTLRLLAVERSETTGEVTADVRSELAEPLDEILSEAARLLEGTQDPDAARRLRAIVDRVDQVKRRLQAVGERPVIRGLVPEEPGVHPVLQDKRVLVADDEDIIRETIADVLAKSGGITVLARDGEEAIAMLRTQHFDLVLSDIKMPYRSGYEVYAAAKEANPDCQVILITGFGYDPEHSIVRASREGLAGVLFKPFKVEQLLETIQKAFPARTG